MTTLDQILSILGKHRRELLDELDAIDGAIAALDDGEGGETGTPTVESYAPVARTDAGVLPRRVASKRMQSDAHKQAVASGKREARHARDAAKGLAREALGDSFVPALGAQGERQLPRLVKRPLEKSNRLRP